MSAVVQPKSGGKSARAHFQWDDPFLIEDQRAAVIEMGLDPDERLRSGLLNLRKKLRLLNLPIPRLAARPPERAATESR